METYKCGKCEKTGVKLWRVYQSFDIDLTCAHCLGFGEIVDEEGMIPSTIFPSTKTDQLGSYIPAVPITPTTEDEYWGYTSVPSDMVQWWKALPSK